MTGKIKNERKKKKQQNILFRILFLLALAVFLYAAVRLILYGITYWKGSHEYKGLQKYVSGQPRDEGSTEDSGEFTVDFAGLKELNPDCIGWIRFENIDISYPIMQGEDNEYYLKHTFEGQAVTAASIFMDANNHSDFTDQNTFIYGHNMKDKTMFGKLNDYKDEEFYKENPYFYIYTPDTLREYKIFAVYNSDPQGPVYTINMNEEEIKEFAKECSERSMYPTGVDVSNASQIVTLSSCEATDYNYRLVVQGVLVKETPY